MGAKPVISVRGAPSACGRRTGRRLVDGDGDGFKQKDYEDVFARRKSRWFNRFQSSAKPATSCESTRRDRCLYLKW